MQSVQLLADRIHLGPPVGTDGLCMVSVTRVSPSHLRYQPLQAALAAKTLRITEVSEAGRVPEVRVINEGDLPVLLLDGAALVGAKQNRVLNITVLVPPHAELLVPVSCVEHGRWNSTGSEFQEGPALHFSGGRARKLRDVSASLDAHGLRHANQARVWEDMAEYASVFHARAPSGAMQDVYQAVEGSADKLLNGFKPMAGQVGAAFVARGELLGLDAFDSADTFAAEFSKIARSYAVDAVRMRGAVRDDSEALARAPEIVADLLRRLTAGEWKSYPGIGLGTDIRLTTSRLAAGALVHEEEVVHLAAFPGEAGEGRLEATHAPAMPRRMSGR